MTSPASLTDAAPTAPDSPSWEAVTAIMQWEAALSAGTRLREYEVRRVIGENDHGIVYLAWDHALRRLVAVKEYLPRALASRTEHSNRVEAHANLAGLDNFVAGLKAFVAEARVLARFDHPALVKVYRFWEENGTAYMVMPFHEGPTLEEALRQADEPPAEAEIRAWLRPLLDALGTMHAAGCYHHHVGPDNILLTATGPVLLDFAAARRLIGGLTTGLGVAVKPGYAPLEQYSDSATLAPGPWTDLYALAAVAYRAITGIAPPPAPERVVADRLQPLGARAGSRYGAAFLQALDAALAVQPENRPANDAEWRALIGGMEAPLHAIAVAAARDLMSEPFGPEEDPPEITIPMPTQPVPRPDTATVADPMGRPFDTAPAGLAGDNPPVAPPFHAQGRRRKISPRLLLALIGATCVVVLVVVLGLSFYAGRLPALAASAGIPIAGAEKKELALVAVPATPSPAAAASALPATPLPAAAADVLAAQPSLVTTADPPPTAAPPVTNADAPPVAPLPVPAADALPTAALPAADALSAVPATAPETVGASEAAASAPASPAAREATPAGAMSSAHGDMPAPTATPAMAPPTPDEQAALERLPANGAERRKRCRSVLEEATLRRLSTTEAAFFKKECR